MGIYEAAHTRVQVSKDNRCGIHHIESSSSVPVIMSVNIYVQTSCVVQMKPTLSFVLWNSTLVEEELKHGR